MVCTNRYMFRHRGAIFRESTKIKEHKFNTSIVILCFHRLHVGHAAAQLVDALRYTPEGRGFDSRWCHWNFSLTLSFDRTMAQGLTQPLTEMSTRNISLG